MVGALVAGVLALAGAVGPGWVSGPASAAKDKDELERERAANQEQLDDLRSQLEGTDVKLQEAYVALETATKELPLAQATLERAQADFADAQKEYEEAVESLKQAEALRDEVTAQLEADLKLARESELSLGALARDSMMGYAAGSSDLLILMGSASIDEAAKDLMAAEAAARTRRSVIVQAQESAGANKNRKARLESVTEEISDLKDKAEDALQRAAAAQKEAEEAKQKLADLKASMESLTAKLETEKKAAQAKQKAAEEENRQIQAELDKILEEERKKAGIPDPPAGGEPPPPSTGFFGRPLSSIRVGSPFGWRVHPIYGTRRHHDGVDLSAGCETPIFASAAGTVVYAGVAGGYGNRIVISHGNVNGSLMFSTYNHIVNGGTLVSNGQSVSKGQQIARVGTTGASTGCHLHFEIGIGSAT
ncbi:MAG: peptidoglycan DD-metalloendopeptidase family protein, partial [Bifidobacteriaceae bacterium]|nr:peptidoglycan DD-metalloendopeptidase family protein [Bifidobacteriaceae bacterium]